MKNSSPARGRLDKPATTRWIFAGEYYLTSKDESLTTVLGSCIAACIRDPVAAVGGMNHFMLPDRGGDPGDVRLDRSPGVTNRYGSQAMESLINGLVSRGARRERLEIKLFGGGRVVSSMTDVGRRNIEFVRNYLRLAGLCCVSEDLGDVHTRRVTYSPLSGVAHVTRMRTVSGSPGRDLGPELRLAS